MSTIPRSPAAPGEIRTILDNLIRERKRLERIGEQSLLDANRLAIVYWQEELSRVPTLEARTARAPNAGA